MKPVVSTLANGYRRKNKRRWPGTPWPQPFTLATLPHSMLLKRVLPFLPVALSFAAQAQPGTSCIEAIPISTGQYTTAGDNYWYAFTPPVTAVYHVTTCGLATCDSKIWVYDHCVGLVVEEGGTNAIAYNDDIEPCGLQSQVDPYLTEGAVYFIRIGDYNNVCGTTPITWQIFSDEAPPPPTCGTGQSLYTVSIIPDQFANELVFTVADEDGGQLLGGNYLGGSVCVDSASCTVFTINDTYGDGIAAPGGIWLSIDSVVLDSITGNFGTSERRENGCPPGFSCTSSIPVGEGAYTAPAAGTWYSFTPAQSGFYRITTCDSNMCDTRIWLYDHCQDLLVTDDNEGTIYYGDDECGQQADIPAALMAINQTYWIRIGDDGGDCGGAINWSISYNGPVSGCTDPGACNYDPFATIDDGSCLQPGDPDCPDGPDLLVVQTALQNSISAQVLPVTQSNCYISEGCLNGFGDREVVRFSTHIKNQGNQDYYIGSPNNSPGQFTFGNCHNHWHYKGYAEYILFNTEGQEVVNGFKNGFCVLDLECGDGGSAQYGCNNMGISHGCGDIYGSGLDCQWIDVTGVPDGDYTLVVRCNWDNSPDALGHYETNHVNNWAQVCLNIHHAPDFGVSISPDCEPYVDCAGQIYGSAQMDCQGVCNGSGLIGDLDTDLDQDYSDAQDYINEILAADITALPCNDANADGDITVTDVALVANCNYFNIAYQHPDSTGTHDHCNFPKPDVTNPFDSVTFTIGDINFAENWLDIRFKNPNRRTIGYELLMSGIEITTVENLVDPAIWPVTAQASFGGQRIIATSFVDSSIARTSDYQPLVRVHFTNPEAAICIAEAVDVVNENYANSTTFLENACVVSTGMVAPAAAAGVRVFPNPFIDETVMSFHLPKGERVTVELLDLQGRTVRLYRDVRENRLTIRKGDLATGTYLYRVAGASGRLTIN